jgi:hypothetical protein
MKNQLIISVIALLLVGTGAFFGGIKYQQSKAAAFGRQMGMRGNGNFRSQDNSNFRPVNGEVINTDEKSITVKLQDGSSKIILVSSSSTINKTETGTSADLTEGTMVMVFGSENSDGSITAQNIQINPTFRIGINTPQTTPVN